MPLSLKVDGTIEMARRLRVAWDERKDKLADAMKAELEAVELPEVIKRTPIDTGALRSTERVTDPIVTERTITVGLEAGGPDAPYAIYVHENLEAHHPVGQAKFLESVINESVPYLLGRIGERMNRG